VAVFLQVSKIDNQWFPSNLHCIIETIVAGRNPAPPGMYKTLNIMG